MSSFDKLCETLEQLDKDDFTAVFNSKSVEVLNALMDMSGAAGIDAYLHFILASVAADGVLAEEEFAIIKPIFDKKAGKDVTYDEAVAMFKEMGLDDPAAYKETIDAMVDIIGAFDENLKDDIVLLSLMVCAVDGKVSDEEKDWIKQLIEPLTIQVDAMDVIEGYLNKAGVFMLGTCDGDKPRMRVLGLKVRLDGAIFFAVGTFKDVYKQLRENPNCEILASVGDEFLRWDGKATFVEDPRLMPIVENMMPDLAKMYDEMGWKLGFFTLQDDTAEVVSAANQKQKIF